MESMQCRTKKLRYINVKQSEYCNVVRAIDNYGKDGIGEGGILPRCVVIFSYSIEIYDIKIFLVKSFNIIKTV